VSWHPSAKLRVAVAIVGLAIVSALALGRPEPVVLAAPFAVTMLAVVVMTRPLDLQVSSALADGTVIEGDTTFVDARVFSGTDLSSLELALVLPDGVSARLEERVLTTSLAAGETRTWTGTIQCDRWGNHRVGAIAVRARGPLGLLVAEGRLASTELLQVLPDAQTLRRLVQPKEPQVSAGNRVARINAAGIEFADVRPFVPGDRARDVNWRATARHGALHVNQQHPDRSTDVVIVVDAFSELTLPAAVGAASALVDAYLRARDRVGLVTMGGYTHWLRAGSGMRQQYLIVRTLLDTQAFASAADKGLEIIPPGVLPRKAMVVALTPLQDERFRRLVADLRARGVDVVVVEVALEPFVPEPPGASGATAHRLWRLQRGVARDLLREQGVPVVRWEPGEPLAVPIEEVAAWSRFARVAG
jgi:uncharacterized protein (DUF58 family)